MKLNLSSQAVEAPYSVLNSRQDCENFSRTNEEFCERAPCRRKENKSDVPENDRMISIASEKERKWRCRSGFHRRGLFSLVGIEMSPLR